MNRLILIGNGFDLAHGMKTSYNDFILWYLKKCFSEALENASYRDEIIEINCRTSKSIHPFKNVTQMIDFFYGIGLDGLLHGSSTKVPGSETDFQNKFEINLKSELLQQLLKNCSELRWVDIENEFYEQLKSILSWTSLLTSYENLQSLKMEKLRNLNNSLSFIIEKLDFYLEQLPKPKLIQGYSKIFNSQIYKRELCIKTIKSDEKAEKTLILNFNYTNTPELYFEDETVDFNVNYIHGNLEKPKSLVFGFGDELDEDYKKLELQKLNMFFEYIKSFWYFKNSKYHNLVRFIDEEEFQVYILGHSCGLSDRTMLNMIFEHDNCKSIKIFYHGTKEKNNYTNLTQEISRHFKDKGMMRKKIVPFDKSEPMPQVE